MDNPGVKSLIEVRPNPLADLFPGIEYLDRGYNQEKLDTDQDYTVDFTIDDQVEHLTDRSSTSLIDFPWQFRSTLSNM